MSVPATRTCGSLGLLFSAGLAGMAVMIMELTANRILAPAFGSSLYTWTNVIAVVLLALALGYSLGGRLADRRPEPRLLGGLLLAAAVLSLPAPFLAVPLGKWLLPGPEALGALQATDQVARGSLAATLALFAAPLFLLGMVGPFVTRFLVDRGLAAGQAAGRTLAVSTLGSLVGTYLPAHLLLPWLGSRGTLLLAAGILLLAALPPLTGRRSRALSALGLWPLLGLVLWGRTLPVRGPLVLLAPGGGDTAREEAVEGEWESPYQYVRVSRWGLRQPSGTWLVTRRLSLDEGVLEFHSVLAMTRSKSGTLEPQTLTRGLYYDFFSVLPELVSKSEKRPLDVAIVGGGAGTMVRLLRLTQTRRVDQIVSFELDPVVAGLGERFGLQPGAGDHLLVVDGRVGLRLLAHRFDLVILDAYTRQIAIPAHLGTREFFHLVRSRLTARGLFALNVSVPDLESPLFLALQRTLGQVFPHLRAVCVAGSWNVVLLASNRTLPRFPAGRGGVLASVRKEFVAGSLDLPRDPGRGLLLTDNRAPLELLARRP